MVATFQYDALNRMTGATTSVGGGSVTIGYDELSRRTGMTFGDQSTQTYQWEIDNDLAKITHAFPNLAADNVVFDYGYDARAGKSPRRSPTGPTPSSPRT